MTGNANTPRNVIFNADCIQAMRSFDRGSVDFILTDPPYLVNYRSRDGRTVANDDNARWLRPAFNQMHRVLKDGGFAVSFYGWNKVDLFMDAWKAAGFRVVGHIVFRKVSIRSQHQCRRSRWIGGRRASGCRRTKNRARRAQGPARRLWRAVSKAAVIGSGFQYIILALLA